MMSMSLFSSDMRSSEYYIHPDPQHTLLYNDTDVEDVSVWTGHWLRDTRDKGQE